MRLWLYGHCPRSGRAGGWAFVASEADAIVHREAGADTSTTHLTMEATAAVHALRWSVGRGAVEVGTTYGRFLDLVEGKGAPPGEGYAAELFDQLGRLTGVRAVTFRLIEDDRANRFHREEAARLATTAAQDASGRPRHLARFGVVSSKEDARPAAESERVDGEFEAEITADADALGDAQRELKRLQRDLGESKARLMAEVTKVAEKRREPACSPRWGHLRIAALTRSVKTRKRQIAAAEERVAELSVNRKFAA